MFENDYNNFIKNENKLYYKYEPIYGIGWIQDKIRKVNGAMAQEGMPLTRELKQKLYNCIIGKSTTEIERKKIIEKYRGIYE